MRIGPKYKLARRLGAPIFEKTQSPKYAQSLARKEKSSKGWTKPKSEYGKELTEKQKSRFNYGITERQLRNYVLKSLKVASPAQKLFSQLETRLDNALYRAGFAKTRGQARQAASHGHLMLNGKRVTIPSIALKVGDKVSLRPTSATSPLFADLTERAKSLTVPAWLEVDPEARELKVVGEPVYAPGGEVFDLRVVIEFYNR